MRRGRNDDWDRPADEGAELPRGLSGPTKDLPPGEEAAWSAGDHLKGRLGGGSGFFTAALAGSAAGALGVGLWVLLTWQTGAIFSVMALGIGYLVGMAVRWAGRGNQRSFGILAAGITLIASLVGLVLSVAVVIAERDATSLREVLETLDIGGLLQVLGQVSSPISIVLLLFAVYESYRVAIVAPSQAPPAEAGREGRRDDDEHSL